MADVSKQADWNQTDENEKDFIKNKPDFKILKEIDDIIRKDLIKTFPKYSIVYNVNGGDQSTCPENFETYYNVFVISEIIPTNKNKSFLGWSLDIDDDSKQYQPYDTIVMDQDVTLYAVWGASESVTSIDEIVDFISQSKNAGSVDDPIKLNIKLPDPDYLTLQKFGQILQIIEDNGKYVKLDLKDCLTQSDTWFDIRSLPATGKDKVISLTFPDTIKTLSNTTYESYLFKDFSNLKEINGQNISIVGDNAFRNCTALTTVKLPNATEIGVGGSAFNNCISLVTISLPNAIKIGSYCFTNCLSLATVNLPSVTWFVYRAIFENCTALSSIRLGNVAPDIGYEMFYNIKSPQTITLQLPIGATGYGEQPTDTTTKNWGNAFRGIGWNKDTGYGNIGSVNSNINFTYEYKDNIDIEDNENTDDEIVTDSKHDYEKQIKDLWEEIQKLKEQSADKNGIGDYITNIDDIDYVISLSTDGSYESPIQLNLKLSNFTLLKFSQILNNINFSGKYVKLNLKECPTPTDTWFNMNTLPAAGKDKIVSLTFPDTIKILTGSATYNNTYYNSRFTEFSSLKEITGQNVTDIGMYSFHRCSSLTSINMPNATKIDTYAFRECYNLTAVDLPNVTTIGNEAFCMCSYLKSINIPNCTSIGDSAFKECQFLISINISNITNIGADVFYGCRSLSQFITGENTTCSAIEDGAALVKGTELVSYPTASGNIDLPDITNIRKGAFSRCEFLESINIPNCTSINGNAFEYCWSLVSINIPKVTSIGSTAFSYCQSLMTVDVPDCTSIGGCAFQYCYNLMSINLPNCTSIGNRAFENCYNLTALDLPNVTTIGNGSFFGCYYLESLNLPNLTSIDDCLSTSTSSSSSPFYGTGITSLDLPKVTSIGKNAFYCCSLELLNIPNCTSIGDCAFYNGYLNSIQLGSNAPKVGTTLFSSVNSAQTITIKIPNGATGYGTAPTNTTDNNWGNAFRGKGWDGSSYKSGTVNSKITLAYQYV